MRVNFIVEDSGAFKYLGCATAAKNLLNGLKNCDDVDIHWNDSSLDHDVAHFHTFGPRSLLYSRRFKGKRVITAHSTPRLNYGNLAAPWLINWFYRPLYNSFDHVIAVSKKCKRELTDDLKIKTRVSTIYNGIDIQGFSPNHKKGKMFRKKHGISDDELIILTVAQRTPRKGIYDFLTAAKQFPDHRFVWIGGFPYHVFSKNYFAIKRAIKKKSDNVLFPGFIPDIIDAYSAADVFLMPSYAEGHSIVMLEALAMELPIIARDVEEFREAFGNNLLYFKKAKDIRSDMLDQDVLKEYREKTKVVEQYDMRKIAQEHKELYESLLEQ